MIQDITQIEIKLGQIIDTVDKQLEQAKNFIGSKSDIILLVGTTGCGKSTIYNLVIDAVFEIEKKGYLKTLKAKHPTKRISNMSNRAISETKQMQFDYIEDLNTIIIDFPGFQDTNGQQDDLQTDLVLYKLSQNRPIKLIYVLEQQGNELTDRGTNFQSFIKSQSLNPIEISIILNKYNGNLSDSEIKNCFIDQLKDIDCFKQKQPENIFTIRIINSEERLKPELYDKKKAFKKFLEKSKKINLKINKLTNSTIIDKYILEQKNFILTSYQNIMDQLEQLMKDEKNQVQIKARNNEIQEIVQGFKNDFQSKELTFIQAFDLILKCTQDIYKLLGKNFNHNLEQQSYLKFKRIFEFYFQFQDQICSYKECKSQKDLIFKKAMDKTDEYIQQMKIKKIEQEYQYKNIILDAAKTISKLVFISASGVVVYARYAAIPGILGSSSSFIMPVVGIGVGLATAIRWGRRLF